MTDEARRQDVVHKGGVSPRSIPSEPLPDPDPTAFRLDFNDKDLCGRKISLGGPLSFRQHDAKWVSGDAANDAGLLIAVF
jgi:hypothetical protein